MNHEQYEDPVVALIRKLEKQLVALRYERSCAVEENVELFTKYMEADDTLRQIRNRVVLAQSVYCSPEVAMYEIKDVLDDYEE